MPALCNVVEKARDHRSFHLDDEDLDAVLASDLTRIQRGSQGADCDLPKAALRSRRRRRSRQFFSSVSLATLTQQSAVGEWSVVGE